MKQDKDNPLDTTDAGRRMLQAFEELVRQQKIQNEESQKLRSDNLELRIQYQELSRRLSQIETDDAAGESKLTVLGQSLMQVEKLLNKSLEPFLQQLTKIQTEAEHKVLQAQLELAASKQRQADEMKALIELLRSSFLKKQQEQFHRIKTLEQRVDALWSESLKLEENLLNLIKRWEKESADEFANATSIDTKLIEAVEKLHKSLLRLINETK